MEHGTTNRRLGNSRRDDRQELQLCSKGGSGEKKVKDHQRRFRGNCGEQEATPLKEQTQIGYCDNNCTPDDIREGMFGYICLRCKYDNLGSFTDH
jgi:hypothetical protein